MRTSLAVGAKWRGLGSSWCGASCEGSEGSVSNRGSGAEVEAAQVRAAVAVEQETSKGAAELETEAGGSGVAGGGSSGVAEGSQQKSLRGEAVGEGGGS